jgi:hypothetical protein
VRIASLSESLRAGVVSAVQRPAPVRPAHVSAIVQIRREFGVPPAHAAASAGGAVVPASAPAKRAVQAPAATAAELSQTQAEFGFEK